MEKNARWDDASLLPERGLSLSPSVDADLRDRIRSLLVSRNQKNPSRTPCPSPNHDFSNRNPEEDRSESHSFPRKAYSFCPTQVVTQLKRVQKGSSDMGVTRFDGPAGHIDADDSEFHARRLSQPDRQMSRKASGESVRSSPTSGLNQKAHRNVLGREASAAATLNRKKTSVSKLSTGTRNPRFYLRTVPPAKDVNKNLRPNPLHVPGSYQSEVDIKKSPDSEIKSPPTEHTSEAVSHEVLAIPSHTGDTYEHSHQAAIEALKEVAKHDRHLIRPPESHPGHDSSRDIISAQTTNSNGQPEESLAKQMIPGGPADPNISPQTGPKERYSKTVEEPVFIIGDDLDKDMDAIATQHGNQSSLEGAPLLSGPQTSEILNELPPVKKFTVENEAHPHGSARASAELQKAKSNGHSSLASSIYAAALNPVEDVEKSASSLLSRADKDPTSAEAVGDGDEATAPLIPDSRRSSQAAPRFSPVSRAMSMLSEMSVRSGLRASSLGSSKYKKLDSSDNLTREPNSRSRHDGSDTALAGDNYRSAIDDDRESKRGAPDGKNESSLPQPKQNHGDGFTKAITDIESVLQEALNIAGQNANSDGSKIKSTTLHSRRSAHIRTESEDSTGSSDYVSSLTGDTDEEANYTRRPQRNFGQGHRLPFTGVSENEHLYHDGHREFDNKQSNHPKPESDVPTSKAREVGPKVDHQKIQQDFVPRPGNLSKSPSQNRTTPHRPASNSTDWYVTRVPSQPSKLRLEMKPPPPPPQTLPAARAPTKEQHTLLVREHGDSEDTVTRTQIRNYVNSRQRPPIQSRQSSVRLKRRAVPGRKSHHKELNLPDETAKDDLEDDSKCVPYVADFETSGLQYHPVYQAAMGSEAPAAPRLGSYPFRPPQDRRTDLRDDGAPKQETSRNDEAPPATNTYNLEGRHHFSIREPRGFSLSRSHRRSPIARDWSTKRKRWTATVACITTAFVGLIIGIYAGEVPAIQYAIADEHHYTILGNVLFFIGLAITTTLFYPLPLLHGRKPYTLAALATLLPLQFPQALAINQSRSPYVATYRVGLLLPRVFAGIAMGFANINFITTLLDLYGSSLQSGNPHQETVNENDVRRHGGGMGIWLSIFTWSAIGSVGLGFLIGAIIISGLNVSWGFWILIILNAAVLLLNIITPEVRRSAYRRSMAEVRSGGDVSRRVARGEIKMHIDSTGPKYFWEELIAGYILFFRMLIQPGFALLALYQGWIYGQVVLTISVSYHTMSLCSYSLLHSCLELFCLSTTASTLNMSDLPSQ